MGETAGGSPLDSFLRGVLQLGLGMVNHDGLESQTRLGNWTKLAKSVQLPICGICLLRY